MFGGLDLRVGRVLNEVAKGSAMTETMDARARLLQSRETTVLAHLEAEKNRDLDATLATFKAGVARLELPGGEIADGPDEVAATYRALFSAFPDLSAPDLDPSSLCHRGNLVIGETRLQGTHMRTFRGLPPTGRRIDMPLVAIFVFDGPDLLCERVYWDRLTLFIQLGVARGPNTRAGKLATLLNHPVTLTRAALRSRRVGTYTVDMTR
jgi:predicted ester cyclase